MPFFELIRFIVNRKSAALRLIFDRPRMLIRLFGFLVKIHIWTERNHAVTGDRIWFLEHFKSFAYFGPAFVIQIAGQIASRQLESLERFGYSDILENVMKKELHSCKIHISLEKIGWLIMTGKQGRGIDDKRQPARTRTEGLTQLNFDALWLVLRNLIIKR